MMHHKGLVRWTPALQPERHRVTPRRKRCNHAAQAHGLFVVNYCVPCGAWNVSRLQTRATHEPPESSTFELREMLVIGTDETPEEPTLALLRRLLDDTSNAALDLYAPKIL